MGRRTDWCVDGPRGTSSRTCVRHPEERVEVEQRLVGRRGRNLKSVHAEGMFKLVQTSGSK